LTIIVTMNTSQEFRLSPNAMHPCIDMQRMFGPNGIWPTPWMETVLSRVAAITKRFPERTIFTRFIPPQRPVWRRYYEKWRQATREYRPSTTGAHAAFFRFGSPRSGDRQAGLFGLRRSSFAAGTPSALVRPIRGAARRSACVWPPPSSQTPNDSPLTGTPTLHRPSRRPYAPPDGR
jgi:hypothetical protein